MTTYYSKKLYTASAAQASSHQFDIAFDLESGSAATNSKPYLLKSHIKAKVGGEVVTDFVINEVPTISTITFGGGVAITEGVVVEVYRETPRTMSNRTVDFTNASLLTEKNLDHSAIHNQLLAQEALDVIDHGITQTTAGDGDAQNKRITNLATPTSPNDACTKDYVDTQAIFNGAASAQAWEFTPNGTTSKFALVSPTPSGVFNELFIVEVEGVMQSPSANDASTRRDFNVYQDATDGLFYLQFEVGSFPSSVGNNRPPNGAKISVQNMGISKSALTGSLIFESGGVGDAAVTVKGAVGQTAAPLKITTSAGTSILEVAASGNIVQQPGATVNTSAVNITPNSDALTTLVVKQNSATHTANLLELQTAAGAEMGTALSKLGHLTIGTTTEDSTYKAHIVTAAGVGGLKLKNLNTGISLDPLLTVDGAGGKSLLSVERDGLPADTWKVTAMNRKVSFHTDGSTGTECPHFKITAGSPQTDSAFQLATIGDVTLFDIKGRGDVTMHTVPGSNVSPLTVPSWGQGALFPDHFSIGSPSPSSGSPAVINVKSIRTYQLVGAGGFAVSHDGSNYGRENRALGDAWIPTGGDEYGSTIVWEPLKIDATSTKIEVLNANGVPTSGLFVMPDTLYKVRAIAHHPYAAEPVTCTITSKTTESFVINHPTEVGATTADNRMTIKFEIYI